MSCTAQDVCNALNQLRTSPHSFIPDLENKLKYFKGNTLYMPGKIGLMTQEGPSAVQECIQALKNQIPVCALRLDNDLSLAAAAHANDIGPKGICGHTGSDGSSMGQRIERQGEWMGNIGENINFCENVCPREIVLQLIVDDGVSSRGHRKNCLNDKFKVVGIALADHKQYKGCCVMDFASEFTKKGSQTQQQGFNQPPQQQQQGFNQPPQQQFGFNKPPQQQGFNQPPQQMQMQQQQGFGQMQQQMQSTGSSSMPPGCVGKSTQTQTTINGNTKTVVTKTVYKMKDGSTREETSTTTTTNG